MRMLSVPALAAFVLATAATPAFAHTAGGDFASFASGIMHPIFGLDHLLAMVAVGLWACMLGRRALWIVPAAFVAMMAVGFGLASLQVSLPVVEPVILASVVVLGLAVGFAAKLDVRAAAGVVGLFALFHGHAHGAELGEAGMMQFAVGFLAATALLHGVGVGLGRIVGQAAGVLPRALGGLTAFAGLALAFA